MIPVRVITIMKAANAAPAVASSDVTNGEAPLTVQFTGDQSTDDVGVRNLRMGFGDGGT